MSQSGIKVFLLTNSDFRYRCGVIVLVHFFSFCISCSNCVMTYLLGTEWKSFFDYVIVSAAKPKFFQEGSQLREVDLATGNLRVGKQPKELLKGRVYNGGSIALFEQLTGAKGDKVLYVGGTSCSFFYLAHTSSPMAFVAQTIFSPMWLFQSSAIFGVRCSSCAS